MSPKQLQTLIARAALLGVTVTESGCLGAVKRLTVTRGYGPSVTYLAMTGDRLLRLSGSESPKHDPLSAMHWHAACTALADELEALV
jgi:hypothetical protein